LGDGRSAVTSAGSCAITTAAAIIVRNLDIVFRDVLVLSRSETISSTLRADPKRGGDMRYTRETFAKLPHRAVASYSF
jgi:hypothetical protein